MTRRAEAPAPKNAAAKVLSHARGPMDLNLFEQAKKASDDLWTDVCWSALACLEAGCPFKQSLETGLYEWNVSTDPNVMLLW